MCGVMGLISRREGAEDFPSLFATLAHRGPNAHNVRAIPGPKWHTTLGHHRLSIIDLEGGTQPMPSGAHTLVFNGEIYNFQSLSAGLGPLRTRSDTEVVLELMRQRGVAALPLLDGFFAFGIFDQERGELVLARDRWGIKPLYFAIMPDQGILFSSELHPFLKARALKRQVPIAGICDYLFWEHAPADQSLLQDVHKLEPGTVLTWRDGVVEIKPFYDHRSLLRQTRAPVSPQQVWSRLEASVNEAMIADVPVGVLLSGGIDSSLIALAAAGQRGKGLPTFSIGFTDADFDESAYARQVAREISSEHFERKLSNGDMLDRLDDILAGLDEPIADPSLIPTRLLCELAREKVRVVLGGDGGDELYGGYPTYRAQRLRPILNLLPGPVMRGLGNYLQDHVRLGDGYQPLAWKLKRLLGRFDREPLRGHQRWMSGTDVPTVNRLAHRQYAPVFAETDLSARDLQTYLYLDLRHYLPYSVLAKVDRASMAVGLECRPPFLSNPFVEQAFRVPSWQKVSFRQTKLILRQTARGRLPSTITARGKRGFALPLGRWLKSDLAPQVGRLLEDSPLWEALDPLVARTLWRDFTAGTGDHAKTFWALLVLHKWMVRHDLKTSLP